MILPIKNREVEVGGLLNRQNMLCMTKVICQWPLNRIYWNILTTSWVLDSTIIAHRRREIFIDNLYCQLSATYMILKLSVSITE